MSPVRLNHSDARLTWHGRWGCERQATWTPDLYTSHPASKAMASATWAQRDSSTRRRSVVGETSSETACAGILRCSSITRMSRRAWYIAIVTSRRNSAAGFPAAKAPGGTAK